LTFAFGAFVSTAVASAPKYMRITLRGVKGVDVEIGPMNSEVENLGLGKGQIQTEVELTLRRNGIPITTDSSSTNGRLFVVVNCIAISNLKGALACSLSMELLQDVRLVRDPNISSQASTWKTGGVAVRDLTSLRQDIRDMADEFSNDYLEQNGKGSRR